jgi:hypothetical protein
MCKEQEAKEIFQNLKLYAQEYKAKFFCIITYPIENQLKTHKKYLSCDSGNAKELINKYLFYNKNSRAWKKTDKK